ncbi:MAG: hypothetical protein KJZ65_05250 [Phycisphaerales bacterium]|nr:hypothetical protein [Phycisphaerales bacterium]
MSRTYGLGTRCALGVAGIAIAAGMGNASEVQCNYSFTHCWGGQWQMQWVCQDHWYCCVVLNYHAEEKCIATAAAQCCNHAPPGNPV